MESRLLASQVDRASFEEDERDATDARRLHRTGVLPRLEADARVGPLLEPCEEVVAIRRAASVECWGSGRDPSAFHAYVADLYLTTSRLLVIAEGPVAPEPSSPPRPGIRCACTELPESGGPFAIDFAHIEDAVVAGGRVLLLLRDGLGAILHVESPRLLCAELGSVRAASRPI